METTTVEVKKKTKQELENLKHAYHAKTFDEVIQKLIKRRPRSMAGKLSIGRKVTVEEIIQKIRDERDKF